jgi:hypothetical protein
MMNGMHLRKLDLTERQHYRERLWQALGRLRARDQGTRQVQAMTEVDYEIRKATRDVLAAQACGEPAPLDRDAKLAMRKHEIIHENAPAPIPPPPSKNQRTETWEAPPTLALEAAVLIIPLDRNSSVS